jgi:endonuclease/exonuclease/phosphatase family metal-dependent hydrolase
MYSDGVGTKRDSGHLALVVLCAYQDHILGLVNTHLRWDPPGTPPERQRGYRQIRQLLQERGRIAPSCEAWIICGDLNVTPASHVVAVLRAEGFDYTHRTLSGTYTCNANARATMVDYVFYTKAFRAQPEAVTVIGDHTPLPSSDQPSDHLALTAHFAWH